MAFCLQAFQHFRRVSAVPEGCIQTCLPRLYLQKIQDFLYHNGNVHSGRCTAFFNDLLDGIRVFLRLQFFIFFFIISWMGAFIADTALVLLFFLFHCCCSFYIQNGELFRSPGC